MTGRWHEQTIVASPRPFGVVAQQYHEMGDHRYSGEFSAQRVAAILPGMRSLRWPDIFSLGWIRRAVDWAAFPQVVCTESIP
jgi:hypothetical protein